MITFGELPKADGYYYMFDLLQENGMAKLAPYRWELVSETLSSPDTVVQLLKRIYLAEQQMEEHMWLICMDNAGKPVGLFEIAHGTSSEMCVTPDVIFRRALLTSATRVILAHNHTSGNTTPSKSDIDTTKRIAKAGAYLDIDLLDHIIIANDGSYYSFEESMPEVLIVVKEKEDVNEC